MKARVGYEEKLAYDKQNPKRLNAYINKEQSVSSAIRAFEDDNVTLKNEPNEIAEIINCHFESVFEKPVDIPKKNPELRTHFRLRDVDITENRVKELLNALNPNKTRGTDRVHPRILKKCAAQWAYPLITIFRLSLKTSELPLAWLEANVTLFTKKVPK